jgi:tRNA dimethylallyltransferase
MMTSITNSAPVPMVVILGPTASGKTGLAVKLAHYFDLEVISADSRQIYRGMDIGTAKPTAEERQAVLHHLIDMVDPQEKFSAADFEEQGTRIAHDINARNKLPVLVGGTGLYIKALTEGLLAAPSGHSEYREKLKKLEVESGEGTLYQALCQVDPPLAARLFPKDVIRIIRGLEVFAQTGKRLSDFQEEHGFRKSAFRTLKLGVHVERESLYDRIDRRVENMIREGLIEETQRLLEQGVSLSHPAMQAIGYRECLSYLDGKMFLSEVIETIQRETRRYAKRQMTWFRKDKSVTWLESLEDFDRILKLIENFILMKGMK